MSITPYNTGNLAKYRFYITYNTITYEVFPANFLDTSINDELETGQIFYRRKFSGVLIFGGQGKEIDVSGVEQDRADDFTLLWAIESADPCARLDLTITKTAGGVVDTYWEGYFSTTDGEFDIDKCTFAITPFLEDDYTEILKNTDIEYNILDIPTVVSTYAYLYLYQTVGYILYDKNRFLFDVIEFLADKIQPGVTVSSEFFNDATNYVTQENNGLNYLTISTKNDILNKSLTTPAPDSTIANMSWNQLMDILKMFNVVWNYDLATDTINVEHISWVGFTHAAGHDLRTQQLSQGTNKYSYDKSAMFQREEFHFAEAEEVNFIGLPITYDEACINNDYNSNTISLDLNVTTDLGLITEKPDTISSDGYVILCNYKVGANYYVETQAGKYIDTYYELNMRLSWANLHDAYFRHERSIIEGYLNGNAVTFWSAKKTKIQDISAIICDDIDPTEEVITELGETYLGGEKARIVSDIIHPNGLIEFKLMYGVPDNTPTHIIDKKAIVFVQLDQLRWGAFLTVPSDANYNIPIWCDVYDAACAPVCSGNPVDNTWVIGAGTRHSFIIINICAGMPVGGSVETFIDVSTMTAAGWDYQTYSNNAVDYNCICLGAC